MRREHSLFTLILSLLEGSPFYAHRPSKAPPAHEKVSEARPAETTGHVGNGSETQTA
jgi:hypothetical protein